MYEELKSRLTANLALDVALIAEAVSWAIDELAERGYDPLTVQPPSVAELIADDIMTFMNFERKPLGRRFSVEEMAAWPSRVLVAFSEAQRLCSGDA